MSQQGEKDPDGAGSVGRVSWIKKNSHYFNALGAVATLAGLLLTIWVDLKLQLTNPPTITADQIRMFKDALIFTALVLAVSLWRRLRARPVDADPKKEIAASATHKKPQEGPRSLVILDNWIEADTIIGSAKQSLVIVDSFFTNQIGDLCGWLDAAVKNGSLTGLSVSIYMASPGHVFGAQRLREWHCGLHSDTPESQKIARLKELLDTPVSDEDRKNYEEFFSKNVEAIRRNVANHAPSPQLFTYPSMVASRVFVIDNTDLIFGWFPLLGSNPTYSCCHLKIEGLEGPEAALAKRLLRQVEIIRGISKPWKNGS